MKKKYKVLSLVFVLLIALVLVGCGRKAPNLESFYADGYVEGFTIVETFDETENIALPDDMKFLMVYDNGTFNEFIIKEGKVLDKAGATTNIFYEVEVKESNSTDRILDIKFNKEGAIVTTTFRQFLNNGVDENVGLAINFDIRTLTHHQGYSFDGNGSEVYLLNSNGSASLLDNDEYTFVGSDYHPRGSEDGKKFLIDVKMPITLEVEGNDTLISPSFDVLIAGGDKPMHSKTANFWNWIFLQMPIAYIASLFGSITGNSFAWAIVLTTILVRTLAWPIYAKTNDMSFKMNLAQPDMQKIQDKYATRKDPESQQKMQMELMAVYKKHNINMLGCLMPILQMPIFLAMFQVVRRITIPGGQFYNNVSNHNLLGIDLSATTTNWANFVFAGLVGVTMYILQKISAKKPSYMKNTGAKAKTPEAQQQEQTMKMVSYFMIVMMVFASFATISLAFYWIIGNLFSIGQTLLNRYLSEIKYKKIQEEKLYGKGYKSNKVIDAEFKDKGDE